MLASLKRVGCVHLLDDLHPRTTRTPCSAPLTVMSRAFTTIQLREGLGSGAVPASAGRQLGPAVAAGVATEVGPGSCALPESACGWATRLAMSHTVPITAGACAMCVVL